MATIGNKYNVYDVPIYVWIAIVPSLLLCAWLIIFDNEDDD